MLHLVYSKYQSRTFGVKAFTPETKLEEALKAMYRGWIAGYAAAVADDKRLAATIADIQWRSSKYSNPTTKALAEAEAFLAKATKAKVAVPSMATIIITTQFQQQLSGRKAVGWAVDIDGERISGVVESTNSRAALVAIAEAIRNSKANGFSVVYGDPEKQLGALPYAIEHGGKTKSGKPSTNAEQIGIIAGLLSGRQIECIHNEAEAIKLRAIAMSEARAALAMAPAATIPDNTEDEDEDEEFVAPW